MVNSIVLVGRPEVAPHLTYPGDEPMATFVLAVDRPGEAGRRDLFYVEMQGPNAQIAADFVKAGSLVGIQGRAAGVIDTGYGALPFVQASNLRLLGSRDDAKKEVAL